MQPLKSILPFHYAWIVVGAVFLATLMAAGVRSTFGVFLKPLEDEFLTNRADVALVASISILSSGIGQPVIGKLLDRYGVRSVAIVCMAIAAGGMVVSSLVNGLWLMYFTFGIVVSTVTGGPGTTMTTVVAARWLVKHRGLAIGIMSAGNGAGQVILIPVAMQLNLAYGWRMTFVLLGLALAVMLVPIGLLIRSNPSDVGAKPLGAGGLSVGAKAAEALDAARKTPLVRALRTHGFWMLAIGFFVCGYTGPGTVSTHLVAYTVGLGLDPSTAAASLGVMGGVALAGTILIGMIIDRTGAKNPLAAVYFIRGVAMVFLLVADDPLRLYIFGVIFGLGSFASVPPTAALSATLFGRMSVGVIYGIIFAIHQIGGAIGSYLGGLLFDVTGSYLIAFYISIALCFVASAASFAIREEPVRKRAAAEAVR